MLYRLVFTLLLCRLEPERAHTWASRTLRILTCLPVGRAAIARLVGRPDPCLRTQALGTVFASPLGVAAGVDKDATWFYALGALGFGFVEVGTLTAEPQAGNPRPRIVRLPRDRALLNRMGFPNRGAAAAAKRLADRGPGDRVVVGVNIGKSKLAGGAAAGAECRAAVRVLAPCADYVVVNVSSPNTPGLREMQATELLAPLLAEVRAELADGGRRVPLLVKISPDLDDRALEAICALALKLALDGIVAVNTTVDRGGLHGAGCPVAFQGGGVSGAPLRARALEVLQKVRAAVGPELLLISVGGVQDAEDVWARILAGATLVQAYTGLIYGGPGWPRRVNRDLARRTHAYGCSSIQELVGSAGAIRPRAAPPGLPA